MANNKRYTVVITRAKKQSLEFEAALKKRGFDTFNFPSIQIVNRKPGSDNAELLTNIKSGYFNWIIFTSSNAVEALHEMQAEGASLPLETKLAVIGDKTARALMEFYGADSVLKPKKFISESLIEEFENIDLKNAKILLVAASKTRDVIKSALEKAGAALSVLVAYDNVEVSPDAELARQLAALKPENLIFTFFSPSAVNSTLTMLGQRVNLLGQAKIVSIGPITSKALNERGYKVSYESADHSEEGVLTILDKYVSLDCK